MNLRDAIVWFEKYPNPTIFLHRVIEILKGVSEVDDKYLRSGFDFALAHAIEEAGEFLAAAGKTQRWGRDSVNPELPREQQERNVDWLRREMADLHGAITRLEPTLDDARKPRSAFEAYSALIPPGPEAREA